MSYVLVNVFYGDKNVTCDFDGDIESLKHDVHLCEGEILRVFDSNKIQIKCKNPEIFSSKLKACQKIDPSHETRLTYVIKKRTNRKKQTAEDFTPPSLVNEILDKLNEYGKESWEKGKTFVDPACGNGNMLIEVLKRKISLKHDPIEALSTIYGTDIMQDNIRECRLRLLKIVKDYGVTIDSNIIKIVFNNIVWTSLSRYPNGSLDYEFKFPNKASAKDINPWVKGINEDGWLEAIEIGDIEEANVEEGDQDFTLFDVL